MKIDDVLKNLKKNKYKGEDKIKIINALLSNIDAIPIESAISINQAGNILIQGKKVEVERLLQIKDSAIPLRDNFLRKLINQQIKWMAIQHGIHNAVSMETLMFSKAVLWILEKEEELINTLTGER